MKDCPSSVEELLRNKVRRDSKSYGQDYTKVDFIGSSSPSIL